MAEEATTPPPPVAIPPVNGHPLVADLRGHFHSTTNLKKCQEGNLRPAGSVEYTRGEIEEDTRLSVAGLKKRYFSWAKERFQGKKFRNTSINADISVSRDGLGEWKTTTKSREQSLSIKLLDVFLVEGQFWKEEPDKNRDPNVEKVVYLRRLCRINEKPYCAVVTVKVYKHDTYHKYYHHYLDDIVLMPET